MSPSHVLEPTYRNLRDKLLQGVWPPGWKLDATKLAHELGVSITPVRDSLHRLVGERLVEAKAGTGFQTPDIDGVQLRALFDWHLSLLGMALASVTHVRPPRRPARHGDQATRSGELFDGIAQAASNREITLAAMNVNARLAVFRAKEHRLLGNVGDEIDKLEEAMNANTTSHLRLLLGEYHQRRSDISPELVHLSRASGL